MTIEKKNDSCYIVDNGIAKYFYISEACAMLHNTEGPAIEFKSGEKHYFLYGMRHNINGPAIEFGSLKIYYLNDKEYSFEEYEKEKTKIDKKKK